MFYCVYMFPTTISANAYQFYYFGILLYNMLASHLLRCCGLVEEAIRNILIFAKY